VLRGHRREWNVAMDNSRTIPGYKYYADVRTGERPPVFVTFLNITDDPGAWVNGVVFGVPAAQLPLLDRRERNYRRREVSAHVDLELDGPVWAYVGREGARQRYRTGLAAGTAVVSEDYVEKVRGDFAFFGEQMLRDFDRTTAGLEVPALALRRVGVPSDGDGPGLDDAHAAVEGAV
jgi:hypothetical protein